jgi:CIC family chloride channel protein
VNRADGDTLASMLRRLYDRLSAPIRSRGATVFIALSIVVGFVVGVAAAALIGALELVAEGVHWVDGRMGSAEAAVLVTIPLGLLMAWSIARRFAPETAGDGVPEATEALAIRSGYIPTRAAPLKIITTALTLGGGGSAGREGPIVLIGGSIGSSIARHTGLGEDRIRSLVAAGAGAAIGASFNAPIAGMLFAMEVILGNFAIRHLNAVVVASVTAAVTTRSLVGEELILRSFPHRVRDARELLLYAALGVLAAVVGWLFLKLIDRTEALGAFRRPWLRPVLFGLLVAALAWAEPEVFGTGQEFVRGLINLVSVDSIVWGTLLLIGGAKLLATALTLGSGGSGGAFMPSLFIGAVLGAAFTDIVAPVWSFSELEPGGFAVVGMAATFAAVARAPLTSILIVFEITQDYGLVLPLMLATSLATLLGDRLHRESVYTMALAKRGIRLSRRSEIDLLDTVRVGDIAAPSPVLVGPAASTADVQALLDETRMHGVPVVDPDEGLVGIVTVTDLVRSGGPSESTLVGDVMTPRPVTATPSTPVSVVLQRMASLGIGRVPVVDEDDPTLLVALFRREDAVKAYHQALGQEVHHDLGRSRLQARVAPGTDFHEVMIPPDSVADGRLLKEIPLPAGVTVVSVRRGTGVVVPDGNTRLAGGDVLTVFARDGQHDQLLSRMHADDTAELELVVGSDQARFFDLEVPDRSAAAGKVIREIAVPGGCTIVSVRRGDEVLIPDGSTELLPGDVLTVFAKPASRRLFAERLLEPVDLG